MLFFLTSLSVVLPLLALVIEHAGQERISERHHSHHDTYAASPTFTRALMYAMLLTGCLGIVLAWLCDQRALSASPMLVLAFFDAFLLTSLLLWLCVRRYRVSTFDDSMMVVPLVGRRVWVRYNDIDRLEWSGVRTGGGLRNLDVWIGGRRVATLRGIVDIEQILMSVDRFDLLPRAPRRHP